MLLKKINKILSRLLSNTLIKWILIPVILLLLWFLLSLSYSSYRSFTVLQFPQNKDKLNNFEGKQILKGQSITGAFTARENNLGIIAVKFGKLPQVDSDTEDTIQFRVKEMGKANWYYENEYTGLQFNSNSYFPFGFKPIDNSRGKIYQFEITSLKAKNYNAIRLATEDPLYLTKYKFSKNELFNNRTFLKEFMVKKVQTFFSDVNILLSSSVFLLPLIFYLTLLTIPSFLKMADYQSREFSMRNLIFKRKSFAYLVVILIFADFIFMKSLFTGFILGLLGFWLIAIYINKLNSGKTFLLAFLVIITSLLGTYLNDFISIDIASAFAYMLLVIGLIQNIFEYRKIYFFK